jgi:O-acetyl-ADP-ribose deacetylase (regulator of RNase III)
MGSRQQTQWFHGPHNDGQRRPRQRPPPPRRPRQPPLHVLIAEAVRRELQPLQRELAAMRKELSSLRQQRMPVVAQRPRLPLKKQLKVFSTPATLHLNEYFEITKLANKGELQLPASPCILTHVKGDLLASSSDTVFMHAVAADLKMSRGFAAKVKRKFPMHATDLPPARLLQPGHVVTQHNTETNTTIMHVVTKFRSHHKIWQNPNQFLSNYSQGLKGALETCKNSRITHLAMPRMGCNLDQLDWRYVGVQNPPNL